MSQLSDAVNKARRTLESYREAGSPVGSESGEYAEWLADDIEEILSSWSTTQEENDNGRDY